MPEALRAAHCRPRLAGTTRQGEGAAPSASAPRVPRGRVWEGPAPPLRGKGLSRLGCGRLTLIISLQRAGPQPRVSTSPGPAQPGPAPHAPLPAGADLRVGAAGIAAPGSVSPRVGSCGAGAGCAFFPAAAKDAAPLPAGNNFLPAPGGDAAASLRVRRLWRPARDGSGRSPSASPGWTRSRRGARSCRDCPCPAALGGGGAGRGGAGLALRPPAVWKPRAWGAGRRVESGRLVARTGLLGRLHHLLLRNADVPGQRSAPC